MARYCITYVPSAAKAIRKLERSTGHRILNAIDALSDNPRPHGCLQLKGGEGELRIRVGDYRIIYEIHDHELVILVLEVGHRRSIYQ